MCCPKQNGYHILYVINGYLSNRANGGEWLYIRGFGEGGGSLKEDLAKASKAGEEESWSLQDRYRFRIVLVNFARYTQPLQVLSPKTRRRLASGTNKNGAQRRSFLYLCRREDLNLHPLRDLLLRQACIPISPLRRVRTTINQNN